MKIVNDLGVRHDPQLIGCGRGGDALKLAICFGPVIAVLRALVHGQNVSRERLRNLFPDRTLVHVRAQRGIPPAAVVRVRIIHRVHRIQQIHELPRDACLAHPARDVVVVEPDDPHIVGGAIAPVDLHEHIVLHERMVHGVELAVSLVRRDVVRRGDDVRGFQSSTGNAQLLRLGVVRGHVDPILRRLFVGCPEAEARGYSEVARGIVHILAIANCIDIAEDFARVVNIPRGAQPIRSCRVILILDTGVVLNIKINGPAIGIFQSFIVLIRLTFADKHIGAAIEHLVLAHKPQLILCRTHGRIGRDDRFLIVVLCQLIYCSYIRQQVGKKPVDLAGCLVHVNAQRGVSPPAGVRVSLIHLVRLRQQSHRLHRDTGLLHVAFVLLRPGSIVVVDAHDAELHAGSIGQREVPLLIFLQIQVELGPVLALALVGSKIVGNDLKLCGRVVLEHLGRIELHGHSGLPGLAALLARNVHQVLPVHAAGQLRRIQRVLARLEAARSTVVVGDLHIKLLGIEGALGHSAAVPLGGHAGDLGIALDDVQHRVRIRVHGALLAHNFVVHQHGLGLPGRHIHIDDVVSLCLVAHGVDLGDAIGSRGG